MQRTKAILIIAAVAAISAFPVLQIARAQDGSTPSTMLLIDGSGSMWARFEADKRAKIDAVRDRLLPVVQSAPGGKIAITSYGHRRRGDCSDVQVIVGFDDPPAPLSGPAAAPPPAAIPTPLRKTQTPATVANPPFEISPTSAHSTTLDAIAKLNPRGKGPFVGALSAAAQAIGSRRPASIVAITDGVDNCQQDACAAAADFAKSKPGVAVHLIALDIDPALQPRLECVPQATGGSFAIARDSAELNAAIDSVAQLTMLAPDAAQKPTAVTEPERETLPGGETLSAKLSLSADSGPLAVPAHWRIFAAGSATPLAESDASEISAKLDPGQYDIEARVDQVLVRQTVTIAADAPTIVLINLNAARIKVSSRSVAGREASPTATLKVEAVGEASDTQRRPLASIVHRGTLDVIVPAGTYAVSAVDGLARRNETVTLAAGTTKSIDMVMQSGMLDLTTAATPEGPVYDDVLYVIEQDDPESPSGRREVVRSRAVPSRLTLAAGTYYVTSKSALGELRQRVAISAGDTVTQRLVLALQPVSIEARIAGKPATDNQGLVYRITELDGDKREILRSLKPTLNVKLAAGRYRVSAHLDAHHIVSSQDITVAADAPLAVVIDVDAAAVTLQAANARPGDTSWEIRDKDDRAVWHTPTTSPKLLLAPGRYTVHLDSRGGRQSAAFDVTSGEDRLIQLGP